MAQGTPVVAIAELGTASILIEGKGALIAPDNALHFSEKVYHLLMNPEHRFELGRQAKAYVLDKWTATLQAERMIKFYFKIIENKHSANDYAKHQAESLKVE